MKYGLKNGIMTFHFNLNHQQFLLNRRKFGDQIRNSNIYYNNQYAKMKIIRSYAFNLIDIDDKNIFNDANKIKIITRIPKTLIMKPGKGNSIVI